MVGTSDTLFAIEGSTAFLTFNRPRARNALTWGMYDALQQACADVDADGRLRAFVVRGAGGAAFAAGTDISQFTAFTSRDDAIAYERRLDQVIDRLERVGVATIAQVEGPATGGGCAIAFACDLRVCTPGARFGMPMARTLGNCLSAANCARLMDMVGPGVASDLLITGRLIDTAEATSLGLVTRLAPPDAVDRVVGELAQDIAANAPLTVRAAKEAMRRVRAGRRLPADAVDDLIAACYGSQDFREGVAAFLARRPPRFTGD
jgi:enoyl-CoA hydratase/carnithine racemase